MGEQPPDRARAQVRISRASIAQAQDELEDVTAIIDDVRDETEEEQHDFSKFFDDMDKIEKVIDTRPEKAKLELEHAAGIIIKLIRDSIPKKKAVINKLEANMGKATASLHEEENRFEMIKRDLKKLGVFEEFKENVIKIQVSYNNIHNNIPRANNILREVKQRESTVDNLINHFRGRLDTARRFLGNNELARAKAEIQGISYLRTNILNRFDELKTKISELEGIVKVVGTNRVGVLKAQITKLFKKVNKVFPLISVNKEGKVKDEFKK